MRGILFKPDMIKAIVGGRKTQTRRLDHLKEINKEPSSWDFCGNAVRIIPPVKIGDSLFQHTDGHCISVRPRYRVGETVYVKETFVLEDTYEYHKESLAPIDRPFQRCGDDNTGHWFLIPHYKASEPDVLITDGEDDKGRIMTHWRSPMFLPEWASRYFIKITDVKAERLQEITEEDATKEGCRLIVRTIQPFPLKPTPHFTESRRPFTYKDHFIGIWDSINKLPNDWQSNPWCFVYTFQLIDK